MKKYEVLVSNQPIRYEIYDRLTSLGLIIPFDPSNPEVNVYAYLPLEAGIDINLVQALNPFGRYRMFVDEYEVQKHITKAKKSLEVKPKDLVHILDYGKVPFTVRAVNKDTAILECHLRNFDYVLEANLDQIRKITDHLS